MKRRVLFADDRPEDVEITDPVRYKDGAFKCLICRVKKSEY